jgi:hypothetical protein
MKGFVGPSRRATKDPGQYLRDGVLKRGLAAILSGNVSGCGRLMHADEEGTVRVLTDSREVISRCVTQLDGRVIDMAGDSVLAVFPSVTRALRSAVGIQRKLTERNACLPPARRMQFRLGIHMGEILVNDGITADLITDLSNLSGLLVIARNTAFTHRGRDLSPSLVGKELGVRYLLEGSVRRADDRVRITAQLIDADGKTHERIYDVAVAGDREIGDDGRAREPVGSTVDIENATFTNTIGAAALSAFWTDPDFDPAEDAFYYVRVIEIPKPRWTTYDTAFYGIPLPDSVPPTVQDRAYTSAIWYSPSKG